MRLNVLCGLGVALVSLYSTARATVFTFNQDPFAGTAVLQQAGRQIVANEDFLSFSTAQDVFALDPAIFGTGTTIHFVNALASNIPADGVNIVVLETFDNDNNPATPFAAGNAADLIADAITTPGPGFFIYFNQNLNLPRLVFSTDLSDKTADLKILARMVNLTGAEGMAALPGFTQANFRLASETPEPSTLGLSAVFAVMAAGCCFSRGRHLRSLSGLHKNRT